MFLIRKFLSCPCNFLVKMSKLAIVLLKRIIQIYMRNLNLVMSILIRFAYLKQILLVSTKQNV